MKFRKKIVDIATDGFIDSFKNYKTRLLQIIPYLELHSFQPENNDEEASSSDED